MKKKIVLALIIATALLVSLYGCGNKNSENNTTSGDNSTITSDNKDSENWDTSNSDAKDSRHDSTKTESSNNDKKDSNSNNSKTENSTNGDNTPKAQDNTDSSKTENKTSITSNEKETNIKEKVIDYILNGQENKPDAQKLKWSETFLRKADIDAIYIQYKVDGGNASDIESFANYMTKNAPTLDNWQELFKKDVYDTYGVNIVKIEHLKDDSYEGYIDNNGSQVPYVVVVSNTGYFHG